MKAQITLIGRQYDTENPGPNGLGDAYFQTPAGKITVYNDGDEHYDTANPGHFFFDGWRYKVDSMYESCEHLARILRAHGYDVETSKMTTLREYYNPQTHYFEAAPFRPFTQGDEEDLNERLNG